MMFSFEEHRTSDNEEEDAMKAKEFTEKWTGEPLICYDEAALRANGLRDGDIAILSEYGLPESAAPYLNFEEKDAEEIGYMEPGYFYLGYTGDGDWIGINAGSGKILVIAQDLDEYIGDDFSDDDGQEDMEGSEEDEEREENEESGEDEENEEDGEGAEDEECEDYDYVGFTLMNTSLEALYECMLQYAGFLQKRLPEGTREYTENVELLKEKLAAADPEAMQREDCFWNEEIKKLL